jgi:hypothetical protein
VVLKQHLQSIWEIKMRSILEQAVIHHLSGDAEQAQELFHQFIVTRARQVHESMRNGEDPLAEGWDDQVNSEEYFNESDLDELEDLEDDNVDGDEFGADADLDTDMDGEAAAEELGDELDLGDEGEEAFGGEDDMGDEAPAETEELEARLEDLEAELERLVAQFDDEQGFEGEEEADMAGEIEDDMAGDDLGGDEMAGDEEGFEADEDKPFEGLGEGDQASLEAVSATVADATEVGTGGKVAGNDKSGLPQKNAAARQGGEPVRLKSSTHKGFEREAAPAVGSMKARKNNVAKGDSNQSSVAAPSNSEGAAKGATKSPVVPAKGTQK